MGDLLAADADPARGVPGWPVRGRDERLGRPMKQSLAGGSRAGRGSRTRSSPPPGASAGADVPASVDVHRLGAGLRSPLRTRLGKVADAPGGGDPRGSFRRWAEPRRAGVPGARPSASAQGRVLPIASVAGSSLNEYVNVAGALHLQEGIVGLEVYLVPRRRAWRGSLLRPDRPTEIGAVARLSRVPSSPSSPRSSRGSWRPRRLARPRGCLRAHADRRGAGARGRCRAAPGRRPRCRSGSLPAGDQADRARRRLPGRALRAARPARVGGVTTGRRDRVSPRRRMGGPGRHGNAGRPSAHVEIARGIAEYRAKGLTSPGGPRGRPGSEARTDGARRRPHVRDPATGEPAGRRARRVGPGRGRDACANARVGTAGLPQGRARAVRRARPGIGGTRARSRPYSSTNRTTSRTTGSNTPPATRRGSVSTCSPCMRSAARRWWRLRSEVRPTARPRTAPTPAVVAVTVLSSLVGRLASLASLAFEAVSAGERRRRRATTSRTSATSWARMRSSSSRASAPPARTVSDQVRILTPRKTERGDYLVVGRAISESRDPRPRAIPASVR